MLNLAPFLPASLGPSLAPHDCIETMEEIHSSLLNFTDQTLSSLDQTLYINDSSLLKWEASRGICGGNRDRSDRVRDPPHRTVSSMGRAFSPNQGLGIKQGQRVDIYIDSRYALVILHVHRSLCKVRELLTAGLEKQPKFKLKSYISYKHFGTK